MAVCTGPVPHEVLVLGGEVDTWPSLRHHLEGCTPCLVVDTPTEKEFNRIFGGSLIHNVKLTFSCLFYLTGPLGIYHDFWVFFFLLLFCFCFLDSLVWKYVCLHLYMFSCSFCLFLACFMCLFLILLILLLFHR